MATGPRYSVRFRRRRSGRTNYKKRLGLLKSELPRLVVRKTNTLLITQLVITTNGIDAVITQTSSNELKKFGWNHSTSNICAAYLTGLIIGKKTAGKQAVLDTGLHMMTKGSKIYSLLKGAVDAGLKIKHDKSVFPDESRISGKHLQDYKNLDIPKDFEMVKNKILGSK